MSDELLDHELLKQPEAPAEAPQVPEATEQPRDDAGRFVSEESVPSEPADEAEVVEAAESAEQAEEPESQSDEVDEQERSHRKRSARERFAQLTAQRKEAEARAEYAERQLSEIQEYLRQDVDPNLEFEDPAKFQQETVRRALAEQRAHDNKVEVQRARDQSIQQTRQMFRERIEVMRDELPADFETKFSQVPVSDVGAQILARSEIGPRIANHLGQNPDVAHAIAEMEPWEQGAELRELEIKLRKPPERRTTKAPPPVKPVQATTQVAPAQPERASVDEIARMMGYKR